MFNLYKFANTYRYLRTKRKFRHRKVDYKKEGKLKNVTHFKLLGSGTGTISKFNLI